MRHSPHFVARQVSNELVLVPVTRTAADLGGVFTLNDVGARVWKLAEECADAAEVARRLAQEYEVTEAQALADVEELLAQLRQIGALED